MVERNFDLVKGACEALGIYYTINYYDGIHKLRFSKNDKNVKYYFSDYNFHNSGTEWEFVQIHIIRGYVIPLWKEATDEHVKNIIKEAL